MEQKLVRKVVQVDGMTCTSCEMRIENALKKQEGVIDAKAIFSSSNVYVTFDANITGLDKLVEIIEKLDYQVKNSRKPGGEKENKQDTGKLTVNQVLGIGIILLALYVIVKHTVGFDFIPQVDQSMGYGILFVVGLLTSLHCIAMCGGINLSQCVNVKPADGERAGLSKLKPSLLYNTGRVISYTAIGGVVGALGSVISFSGAAKGVVAILSGVFMVIMGLNMLNIFPWLRKLNPRLPRFFGNKIYGNSGEYGPFYVGLLNGLMPCGPLQAMQLYALGTGSFAAGAFSMLMFSLGTVPLMFGFGAISSFLSNKFTHRMLKVSAVLVIGLGVIMMNRGLALSGANVAFAAPKSGNVAQVQGDVQTVTTKLEAGGYPPIVVQKGIPVKWTLTAEKSDLNGCNNAIIIPEFNIQKKLVPGENIIEFTPEKEGNITYSCWMGMIRSNIKVVTDTAQVPEEEALQTSGPEAAEAAEAVQAGGCCAAGSKAVKFAGGKIPVDEIAVAKIENGTQYVTMNVNDYGFSPAVIVMQKDVETRWVINGEQLNSCNQRLVFPQYNANINLKEGENEIKFVPEGDFTFSCWMGMLNAYVKVVDDIGNINLEEIKAEVEKYKPEGAGAGCCGIQ